MEASSGSPGAHINERMIADALIEAGLVTGRRLVGSDLRAWQQLWTYDGQLFHNLVREGLPTTRPQPYLRTFTFHNAITGSHQVDILKGYLWAETLAIRGENR